MQNQVPERSVFQRVALLLSNLPRDTRQTLLQSLQADAVLEVEPHAREVAQACRNALAECASTQERQQILLFVGDAAEALEEQRLAFERERSTVKLVATISDYLHDGPQRSKTCPVLHNSLELAVLRVIRSAQKSLDITFAYISEAGARILIEALGARVLRGLTVRILTLLTSVHLRQNVPGLRMLIEHLQIFAAQVLIFSPNDEQAKEANIIALMHAKSVIADDGTEACLMNANISVGGLKKALEYGVFLRGPKAKDLWALNNWVLAGHQPLQWSAVLESFANADEELGDDPERS
jgi:phosphatidylserine/phosphatidylglycerophosphate/cardiolipin synthase-like enzyme